MSGHPFTGRGGPFVGQDSCMVCGKPEAAHDTVGLAGRVRAAEIVVAEFHRSAAYRPADAPAADWMAWALRLGQHLQQVLGGITLEQLGADSAVRKVEQIRLVLDQVLSDELADRQYGLEEIDEILRGQR